MKTRYKELNYEQHGKTLWRIIDSETGSAIGPLYLSKAELLSDLHRYATEYGL